MKDWLQSCAKDSSEGHPFRGNATRKLNFDLLSQNAFVCRYLTSSLMMLDKRGAAQLETLPYLSSRDIHSKKASGEKGEEFAGEIPRVHLNLKVISSWLTSLGQLLQRRDRLTALPLEGLVSGLCMF